MSCRRTILLVAALVVARAVPLSGQEPASPGVQIDSITVRGNVRQADPVVLADFGIRTGDVVTRQQIQRAVQRLYATGQYDDVRIFAAGGATEPTTLIVEVKERPFITAYEFRGVEHISTGTVRDSAGLEANEPIDPSAIVTARNKIQRDLAQKGYVTAEIDTLYEAGARPGEYSFIFEVEEGRRLVVAGLEFVGNEELDDGALTGAMSVRPEGFFWWKTGEYRQEAYQTDLEQNLVELYGSRGYLDFQVLGDSMVVDPETGKTRLRIEVEEGPQYRIGEFVIEGNRHFATEFLARRFEPGQRSLLARLFGSGDQQQEPVFNTAAWREATTAIRQLYRNSGYLYAEIEPVVERLPEDAEDGGPRVRLKWRIRENQQAYINLVSVAGNSTTHERVIRDRIVVLPGDVYGDERVVSSYQNIQGLGFFEQLPPQDALAVEPNEEGNINITFRVKERQTGNINFGASMSPTTGLAGFLGYEQPNLFGQAKSGRFRWLFGSQTNDIELGYSDPALFGTRNSLSINLRNSRDRFGFVGLGRRRQIGGSLQLGTPLFGARWTRVSLTYALFRDEFDSDDEELDLEQRELLNVGTRSSVTLRVTRDNRNHPLFPTRGSRNSVSLELAGGLFGGDGNYRSFRFSNEWWTPIARLRSDPTKTPIDLVAGLTMQGGAIFGDNPFFLERFFMGGVQYGIPLRGYEELTITPSGHIPRATPGFSRLDRVGESYFALKGEIGVQLGGNFFVSAFYDAGNVWESAYGFNPTDLLRGVGVGVSLTTPVGPLGLDYAYGIDRRDILGRPDPGWRLHVRFGQIF